VGGKGAVKTYLLIGDAIPFTEDIKSTEHCSHAQHRRGERTLMRRGLPEGQKQEGAPKHSPPRVPHAQQQRGGEHAAGKSDSGKIHLSKWRRRPARKRGWAAGGGGVGEGWGRVEGW
jgi:hypothetical protein